MRTPIIPPARPPVTAPDRFMLHADIIRLLFLHDDVVMNRLISIPLVQLSMSSLVAGQLHQACILQRTNQRLERAAELLLRAVDVVAWDARAARRYGALCYELERAGVDLDLHQRHAAAHALCLNAVLVTTDPVFLQVPGLPQENWSIPVPLAGSNRRFGMLPPDGLHRGRRTAASAEDAAGGT